MDKHLDGRNGGGRKDFGFGIVPGSGIVADVTTAADVFTGTVAKHMGKLFIPGCHRCKSGGMLLTAGIDGDKDLQSFAAGTDKESERKNLLPEKSHQRREIGYMIEVEPHYLRIGLQLACLMPSLEYPRRSKSGELAFQGTCLFFLSGNEYLAISGYFMYPAAGTDQDNDFFE